MDNTLVETVYKFRESDNLNGIYSTILFLEIKFEDSFEFLKTSKIPITIIDSKQIFTNCFFIIYYKITKLIF